MPFSTLLEIELKEYVIQLFCELVKYIYENDRHKCSSELFFDCLLHIFSVFFFLAYVYLHNICMRCSVMVNIISNLLYIQPNCFTT